MDLLGSRFSFAQGAPAAEEPPKRLEGKGAVTLTTKHLKVEVSTTRPQLLGLSVDSLGLGRFRPKRLEAAATRAAANHRAGKSSWGFSSRERRRGTALAYRRQGLPPSAPARWTFQLGDKSLTLVSRWSEDDPPEPVVLEFDPRRLPRHVAGPDQPGRQSSGCRRCCTFPPKGRSASPRTTRRGRCWVRCAAGGRRGLREDHVSPGDQGAAAGRVSLGSRRDLSAAGGHRRRSALQRFPPRLAEHLAVEPAICACWPIMPAATPAPSATTSTPTSPGTRRRWPRGLRRWTWFARAWIGSWKACRPTACPAMLI